MTNIEIIREDKSNELEKIRLLQMFTESLEEFERMWDSTISTLDAHVKESS